MERISTRLQGIFNELELINDPKRDPIKVVLQECISAIASVEANFRFLDLEEDNERLKAELESLKKDSAAQIQILRSELDALLKKQAEREQKEAELPEPQMRILWGLPSTSEPAVSLSQLYAQLNMPRDEFDVHFGQLEKLRYATTASDGWGGSGAARRTDAGNKYVLAKRMAGEEPPRTKKYANLPEIEEAMLLMMIGEDEGINEEVIHGQLQHSGVQISFEMVKFTLRQMEKRTRFCHHDPMEATYGTGHTWGIMPTGLEYFAERGKL